MKKILIILSVLFIFAQTTAFAELHKTQISNVSSIHSSFNYKDPELFKSYIEKKTMQRNALKEDSKNQEELIVPPTIFSIHLNNDQFYNKDNSSHTKRVDIGFTSHDMTRNFLFDKQCPPYLIVSDGKNIQELHFKEFKFDNPYWISFSLTPKEIELIQTAQEITVVLPEAEENIFFVNKRKEKIEKKSYKKSMNIIEQSFNLPAPIISEWKKVLENID